MPSDVCDASILNERVDSIPGLVGLGVNSYGSLACRANALLGEVAWGVGPGRGYQ
jgi:hypothetical protein